jgi:hypothetical protein
MDNYPDNWDSDSINTCCQLTRLYPRARTYLAWQYHFQYQIHIGMPLSEAEGILGPAPKEENPPGLRFDDGIRAAVQGDEFYRWERRGMEIWVGVRDGKICDKWFYFAGP